MSHYFLQSYKSQAKDVQVLTGPRDFIPDMTIVIVPVIMRF